MRSEPSRRCEDHDTETIAPTSTANWWDARLAERAACRHRTAAQDQPMDVADERRGCLPSGHPLSWGMLTAGTILDGDPYLSFPSFNPLAFS
jgi:hypothetical protein